MTKRFSFSRTCNQADRSSPWIATKSEAGSCLLRRFKNVFACCKFYWSNSTLPTWRDSLCPSTNTLVPTLTDLVSQFSRHSSFPDPTSSLRQHGKWQRRNHAHRWHQSARAHFPGTRFLSNFRFPRIPTNQIRVLLARAELQARAAGRFLGVYKESEIAS